MASVGAFAWRPRAHFGTPLTRFVPSRELHLWTQRVRSHGGPALISAHPSHVSCFPGGVTDEGPSGCVRMVADKRWSIGPGENHILCACVRLFRPPGCLHSDALPTSSSPSPAVLLGVAFIVTFPIVIRFVRFHV